MFIYIYNWEYLYQVLGTMNNKYNTVMNNKYNTTMNNKYNTTKIFGNISYKSKYPTKGLLRAPSVAVNLLIYI